MGGESSERRVRRLLVIAYYFPPRGGGGVQRIAKFVRYLPEFGWLPTVLTVATTYYGSRNIDVSHVADFPDVVEIIRTPRIDPVVQSSPLLSVVDRTKPNRTYLSGPMNWLKRLRLFARQERVTSARFHPKGATQWCFRAVTAGLRAHRRQRFELILATGEPYSDFLVAWMLSRLTRVPFVLDMRDPWTLDPYEEVPSSGLRRLVESWAERRMLLACSACIFANRSIDRYANTFPRWKQKFHYIPNGYDSADLDDVEAKRFDKFTIVHNGTFLPGYRTADTFLLALRDLLNGSPELRQRIQVLFVGRIGQEEKLVHDLSLDDIVQQLGYLPHRRSIEYVKGADLLLLVGGRHRWEETAKVYEYLAAGKPILALLQPDGAAAELLRRHSTARIVDRENVLETSAALAVAVAKGFVAQPTPKSEKVVTTRKWERRNLTEQLAQILDTCL
jgi:glycosyltransferase involved in cell wall biosynthesis